MKDLRFFGRAVLRAILSMALSAPAWTANGVLSKLDSQDCFWCTERDDA